MIKSKKLFISKKGKKKNYLLAGVKKKSLRKVKRIHKNKQKIRKIILLIILLIAIFTVIYPFVGSRTENQINNQQDKKINLSGIVIFPGSSEKLHTQTADRITVNYKTNPHVKYQDVIVFYVKNMPKLGWKLISSSDIDAVFEKGTKKIRIWILYVENKEDNGIDYIIDYSPGKEELPPLI